MSSFVRFVLKFKKEDSPWGDVAKDFAHEQCEIKHTWGYRTTKKYLEEFGATDRVLTIVEEMNDRYKTLKREDKLKRAVWMGQDD